MATQTHLHETIVESIATSENPLLKLLARALRFPFNFFQIRLLSFQKDERSANLIKQVSKEVEMTLWYNEMYHVFSLALSTSKKEKGDFAEVGVYKGSTAKLMCEAKGDKALHLFDTFEGLPTAGDSHVRGQFAYGLENVQKYLSDYDNVYFYKGLFPETAKGLESKRFSFVHLDTDLYQSTKDALEFFYPRMIRGGIIVSHDYSTIPEVKRAFDEFFSDKPETVLELCTSQCLVTTLR